MRLADAEVLPYQFTGLAETVGKYAKEVEKLAKDKQDEIRERNRELDDGLFKPTPGPRQPGGPPARDVREGGARHARRGRGRRGRGGGGLGAADARHPRCAARAR